MVVVENKECNQLKSQKNKPNGTGESRRTIGKKSFFFLYRRVLLHFDGFLFLFFGTFNFFDFFCTFFVFLNGVSPFFYISPFLWFFLASFKHPVLSVTIFPDDFLCVHFQTIFSTLPLRF